MIGVLCVFVVEFQLNSKFNNNNNNNNNNKTKICQFIYQVSPKPPLRRKIGIVTKSLETHGPKTRMKLHVDQGTPGTPRPTIYKWMFGDFQPFSI